MAKFIRKNLSLFIFLFIGASLAAYGIYDNRVIKKNYNFSIKHNAFIDGTVNLGGDTEPTPTPTPTEITPTPTPTPTRKTLPPVITGKAFSVIDLNSGNLLADQNADMQLPPASVSKIMTAIIALEEYDLAKAVVVPEKCTTLNATRVGFKPNEVYSLEDMLYGLLVKSGADAACSIAYIDGEPAFIDRMNKKSKDLGLTNTNFQNEIGLDSASENKQLSSVNDIVKMSKYALKSSIFRKIIGSKSTKVKALNNGKEIEVINSNDLLFSIPGTVGIKTGNTEAAKGCLAYLYENRENQVLIVLLGSDDRFGDTKKLLEWGLKEITGIDTTIETRSTQPIPSHTAPILPTSTQPIASPTK